MKACKGGWCTLREICPHHITAERAEDDEDRLCLPDHDGCGKDFPIRITRNAGSWGWQGTRRLLAEAKPFDGLVGLT